MERLLSQTTGVGVASGVGSLVGKAIVDGGDGDRVLVDEEFPEVVC